MLDGNPDDQEETFDPDEKSVADEPDDTGRPVRHSCLKFGFDCMLIVG